MRVLDCLHKLVDIVASLDLVEALAALDQIGERPVRADVEHDVDVLLVFEVAVEAHDVLVVHRAVNLDLAGQFLTSLCPGEVDFRDDLQGPSLSLVILSLDWLDALHLVAFGEATLAEETASSVGDDFPRLVLVLRIYRLDLLLNDLI